MRVIVIRDTGHGDLEHAGDLLRYALAAAPLDRVVLEGSCHFWSSSGDDGRFIALVGRDDPRGTRWVIPKDWSVRTFDDFGSLLHCDDSGKIDVGGLAAAHRHPWLVVSNGRFVTRINSCLLADLLSTCKSEVVAVHARADLLAYSEHICLTPQGELVGYRRRYRDSIEPMPSPTEWPHHLFIRQDALRTVSADGLPVDFGSVIDRCRSAQLSLQTVGVAGSVFDMCAAEGLADLSRAVLARRKRWDSKPKDSDSQDAGKDNRSNRISPSAKLIGPLLMGNRVTVEPGAIVVGPAILCDECRVEQDAIIDSAIVGQNEVVAHGHIVRNALVVQGHARKAATSVCATNGMSGLQHVRGPDDGSVYRTWSMWSYPNSLKRAADIIAAAMVLILFAPVFPFIGIAVKVSSPGPVFFRDKRQGRHGKVFGCIKFRTMKAGADKIQDKLRFVSEVDGPQFKIAEDPRITVVGRFLRETYLDEIPQFYNVLLGQMSVVGPRPSPESENTLCPWWRDARLSVRPGITGLWQVCRTRRPFKDFQEWIHYDTAYVQDLSLKLDLWICWLTAKRMIHSFVTQF